MATVSHASLTGADLHEPKGAASAASGTVYVANGAGTGSWTTLAALTGTVGRIEMFATPVAPTGYLECTGAEISRATYADLFAALTIQVTGTRTNGSVNISVTSTGNLAPGYFCGGTGIVNGTRIASITGPTTLTLDTPATSSGSATLIFSPWSQGNGSTTFNIPSLIDAGGRFPRSRTPTSQAGTYQTNQNAAHTHTGATGTESVSHTHSGTTDSGGTHTHGLTGAANLAQFGASASTTSTGGIQITATSSVAVVSDGSHTHTFTSGNASSAHTHTFTTDSSGGTETRPDSVVLLFCIKY